MINDIARIVSVGFFILTAWTFFQMVGKEPTMSIYTFWGGFNAFCFLALTWAIGYLSNKGSKQ